AVQALTKLQQQIGFEGLLYDDHIGKLSLIGAGMRSHPGVSATFFAALAEAGVNVEMISTSEIRISVVTRDVDLDSAVRAVHDAFELGAGEEQAVVYGGTGRLAGSGWSAPPVRSARWSGGSCWNGISRSARSGSSPRPGRPAARWSSTAGRSRSRTPGWPTRPAWTSRSSRPARRVPGCWRHGSPRSV